MRTIMRCCLLLITILMMVPLAFGNDSKREMVEKKWFKNDNTFVIICKGWPKEGLTGAARIDSAKEAALINAQFTARDLFDSSIDVVKNGTIEKYKVYDNYATVQYAITYKGLRSFVKK